MVSILEVREAQPEQVDILRRLIMIVLQLCGLKPCCLTIGPWHQATPNKRLRRFCHVRCRMACAVSEKMVLGPGQLSVRMFSSVRRQILLVHCFIRSLEDLSGISHDDIHTALTINDLKD